ncbi:hypothetical protein OFO30_30905, partial [Escherichia coli]|nr:hypothetical protein [Escherichia coli]
MPKVSVITAVHNGGHHFLREAYTSLRDQELPSGWEWEWCLQEDGDSGVVECLPPDERVLPGSGLPGRAAVARTMAL